MSCNHLNDNARTTTSMLTMLEETEPKRQEITQATSRGRPTRLEASDNC